MKADDQTNASCLSGSGSQGTLELRAIFRRHALISEVEGAEKARARITIGDTRLSRAEDRKLGPR